MTRSDPWDRLTCSACGRRWERRITRGPRPLRCPECRAIGRYSVVHGTTVYLGPGKCRGCGARVWWASANTRIDGINTRKVAWREKDGRLHQCVDLASALESWDNGVVGISDASPDIMCDALLVADTSREGVPRLEVSAP